MSDESGRQIEVARKMIADPQRDCCAQMGLQRRLLLAKALRRERCAAKWAKAKAGMRVQRKKKMRVDGVAGGVVVVDV